MGTVTVSCKIIPFLVKPGAEDFIPTYKMAKLDDSDVDRINQLVKWVESQKSLSLTLKEIKGDSSLDKKRLTLTFDHNSSFFSELQDLGAKILAKTSFDVIKGKEVLLKKGDFVYAKEISLDYTNEQGETLAECSYPLKFDSLASLPTPEQAKLYNQFLPVGFPFVEPSEFAVYYLRVADNLINRSLSRWTEPDLLKMTEKLPGIPVTLDHDWENNIKAHSLVISAGISVIPYEEIEEHPWLLQKMETKNLLEENMGIVKKEGYISAIAQVAIPMFSSPILQKIRFGLLNAVSLGGFEFQDLRCPICQTSFFDRKKCLHKIPTDDNQGEQNVAPFSERIGIVDLNEASFVLVPNLPAAGIIQKRSAFSVMIVSGDKKLF